jgi:hypothetical protein
MATPESAPARLSSVALNWLERVLRARIAAPLQLHRDEGGRVALGVDGEPRKITFTRADHELHTPGGRPGCQLWDARAEGWPCAADAASLPAPGSGPLYAPLIERTEGGYDFHYDLPGLVYWALGRVEEIDSAELDRHGRFPASASHAFRHQYLERPIVDEWLRVLADAAGRLWPQLKLQQPQFEMHLSHDVDFPSRYAHSSARHFVRSVGQDLLRRGRPLDACRGLLIRLFAQGALHPRDPYNTFDWIMTQSERIGTRSSFYFVCGGTAPEDPGYDPAHPAIRALMREIHARGHEIGIHPSYECYLDPGALKREATVLRRICAEEGIEQPRWGGRMHYLRWRATVTPEAWRAAGLDYDATLGYADHVGFRAGTCHEYPGFNPVTARETGIAMKPLIAMDSTLTSGDYMGTNAASATACLLRLRQRCHEVGGCFSLLLHNSELIVDGVQDFYLQAIEPRPMLAQH